MTVRRVFLTAVVALGFLGLYALTAHADMVPAPLGTGSRSTPPGSGVISTDGWDPAALHGFEIAWDIQMLGAQQYQYTYSFLELDGVTPVEPEADNFILEFGPGLTAAQVAARISNVQGYDSVAGWQAIGYSAVQTWTSGTETNLPSALYGIKFGALYFPIPDLAYYKVRFTWPYAPIWGDFYLSDGLHEHVVCTAYNTGEGVEGETSPFTDWIPTPGIPEPSSLLLLVLGSSAVLGSKLRSRKK